MKNIFFKYIYFIFKFKWAYGRKHNDEQRQGGERTTRQPPKNTTDKGKKQKKSLPDYHTDPQTHTQINVAVRYN